MVKERHPRQMYLSQVHPEGYSGYWKKDIEAAENITLDPESDIAKMHVAGQRERIIASDVSFQWRRKLKQWGYTLANRNEKARKDFKKAVDRLKEEGVWEIVLEASTAEELEVVRAILAESRDPVRVPDSSENLTFYPDEASWWKDVYGEVPKEVLIEELTR
jgi:hypothetical protein